MARTKSIALALIFLSPSLAGALPKCGTRDEMLQGLQAEYGEHVVATATARGNPTEITANPTTGSWTMLITNPDTLQTCAILDGAHWSVLEKTSWGRRI